MTDQRNNRMDGFYWIERVPYLSVTNILKIVDKSGPLMWWFGGQVYDAVMKSVIEGNPLSREDALRAPRETSDKAKDRGTSVHSIVEAWKNIDEVVGQDGPFKQYAIAFKKWLLDNKVEVLENERTVVSHLHKFAGTLDMLAKVNGKTMIIDVKTGKDIYKEAHLQVSAYKEALKEAGTEVDGMGVLLLKPTGTYKFELCDDKLQAFLAAKSLYEGINYDRLEEVGYFGNNLQEVLL